MCVMCDVLEMKVTENHALVMLYTRALKTWITVDVEIRRSSWLRAGRHAGQPLKLARGDLQEIELLHVSRHAQM